MKKIFKIAFLILLIILIILSSIFFKKDIMIINKHDEMHFLFYKNWFNIKYLKKQLTFYMCENEEGIPKNIIDYDPNPSIFVDSFSLLFYNSYFRYFEHKYRNFRTNEILFYDEIIINEFIKNNYFIYLDKKENKYKFILNNKEVINICNVSEGVPIFTFHENIIVLCGKKLKKYKFIRNLQKIDKIWEINLKFKIEPKVKKVNNYYILIDKSSDNYLIVDDKNQSIVFLDKYKKILLMNNKIIYYNKKGIFIVNLNNDEIIKKDVSMNFKDYDYKDIKYFDFYKNHIYISYFIPMEIRHVYKIEVNNNFDIKLMEYFSFGHILDINDNFMLKLIRYPTILGYKYRYEISYLYFDNNYNRYYENSKFISETFIKENELENIKIKKSKYLVVLMLKKKIVIIDRKTASIRIIKFNFINYDVHLDKTLIIVERTTLFKKKEFYYISNNRLKNIRYIDNILSLIF